MENAASTKPLRCYIAGVQHESSSFSPIPTSVQSFTTVQWGADAHESTLGLGYGESCDLATALGFEVVAGPFSGAQPSLPATDETWTQIRDSITDELHRAGTVDIVCLHGA